MAIAFATAGPTLAGSTSLNLALPASIALGDILVISLGGKYPANPPDIPTAGGPWRTHPTFSGGAGASGVDSGQTMAMVLTRIVDQFFLDLVTAGLTNIPITITGGNVWEGKICRYTKAGGTQWGVAVTGGSDSVADASWSVTMPVNIGLKSGDFAITISAINSDTAFGTLSGFTLTATGATIGTANRANTASSTGDDFIMHVREHAVTAGDASAPAVFAMSATTPTATSPTGATLLLRLRETTLLEATLDANGVATPAFAGQSNTPGSMAVAGSVEVSFLSVSGTPGQLTSDGVSTFDISSGQVDTPGTLSVETTGEVDFNGSVDTAGGLDSVSSSDITFLGLVTSPGILEIVCTSLFEESPDKGFLTIAAKGEFGSAETDYRPTKGAGGINGAIRDFKTGIYTVLRTPRGTFNDEGEYVAQTPGVFTTDMVVQPGGSGVRGGGRSGGKELQVNPEGQSAEDERLIFTTEELFTRTPTHDPDIVIIKDEPYKVERVKLWEAFGSSHYEVYACRMVIP